MLGIFFAIHPVSNVHGHGTRSARAGLFLSTRDHRSVAYRVPKEWASMGEEQRGVRSLGAFKRRSREGFLSEYGSFVCGAIFKSLLVITAIFAKTN